MFSNRYRKILSNLKKFVFFIFVYYYYLKKIVIGRYFVNVNKIVIAS